MTKIIKLTNPLTGHVRSREEIKADPECRRPYFPHPLGLPDPADHQLYKLMNSRTKEFINSQFVTDSSYGYGNTMQAFAAIARATMTAKQLAGDLNDFAKRLRAAALEVRVFWQSPIESTYLQHHHRLPGRKGNARQRKKAFKKAENWYYNVYLECEVSQ